MKLDRVTLCCIDTHQHDLSALAIRKSLQKISFAKTIVLTDRGDHLDQGWDWLRIDPIRDYASLNQLMLKGMPQHIDTDFMLNIQYDGFVINPALWRNDYLDYDYIGAPWPDRPAPHNVGNGGFSLRSRRLLLALQDPRIQVTAEVPWEDQAICRLHRPLLEQEYGIRFAPIAVAQHFACELPHPALSQPPHTFGFHGYCWMLQALTPSEIIYLAEKLADYSLKRSTIVGLAATLVLNNMDDAAAILIRRVAKHQSRTMFMEFCRISHFDPGTMAGMDKAWDRFVP